MESPFPSRAELDPPEQTPHVCLLACSPHPDGSTDAAARLLEQTLLSRGATVDRIRLREYAIHPCIGCGFLACKAVIPDSNRKRKDITGIRYCPV